MKNVLSLDWKNIRGSIGYMSEVSGRSKFDIIRDIINMYRKEGYSWLNYNKFEFYKFTDPLVRNTFISDEMEKERIQKLCNNPEKENIFIDKGVFARHYAAFLGRDILDLREASFEEFAAFLAKHPDFMAKPARKKDGEGIMVYRQSENFDIQLLFDKLMQRKQYIMEELIEQNEQMSQFSLNSINTIRMASAINREGVISIPYMVLRFSLSDSYLDNESVAGYYTKLDDEGRIYASAHTFDPVRATHDSNPLTQFAFLGMQIPMIQEAKELVIKAAQLHPDMRYIGWDVAISKKGPVIIEANNDPAATLYQTRAHMKDGLGMKPVMEEALGIII